MDFNDTIAAIASGMGNSGIGIIRVSGKNAISIVDNIFCGKKKKVSTMETYTAAYGHIMDNNEIIDEVIVLVMKGPNTYTAEDVVEINCHGGIIVLKRVLDLLIRKGVRISEPGEFTKRAFLNGRIDMTQAESIMELINSKNEIAVKSSILQLKGGLKEKINVMRDKLIYNIAYIESALDDPENYSLEGYPQQLLSIVDEMLINVDNMLISSLNGRLIKEGIKTVIIGRPNAGKSSILNMMLGEERAIVTEVEGTTRDTLEELININGIILNIVDTAGIRDTEDVVEKIGVDKAISNITDSDLILYIVDGSKELDTNDFNIIDRIKHKKVITIINKNDLNMVVDKMWITTVLGGDIIELSAKYGTGKEDFYNILKEMFFQGNISYNDELYITNLRHKNELYNTKNSLENVKVSINMNMEEDFFTIDLMEAYKCLGLIIGEELEDDIVNKIFKEFCMGK